MTVITTYLSKITLNVNGLNSPIKRHRLVGWIKKTKLSHLLLLSNANIGLLAKTNIGLLAKTYIGLT
jgi:hypothetical protein